MMRVLTAAALIGASLFAAAFTDAADLESYRKKYNAVLEEIVLQHGASVIECNEQYAKSLGALLVQVKKQGDLDRTKAVMAEEERFKREKGVPAEPDADPDIKMRQAAYTKREAELELDKATRIVKVALQYDKILLGLQKELTASDRLEEATAVQEERKKTETSDVVVSAKTTMERASASLPPKGTPPPVPEKPEVNKTEVIGTIDATVTQVQDTSRHAIQVWRVLPPYAKPGRYRLSMQHAAAGADGAFRMVVWADKDGDGVPDKLVDRSREFMAKEFGEWSKWEFKTPDEAFFVGNSWSRQAGTVFYSTTMPVGYKGLGDEVFHNRSEDDVPTGRTGPRFTSIRLEYLGPL